MNLEIIKNNIYCRAPFIGHCINKCGENFCCHSYNKNNLSLNEKRKTIYDGNIDDICKICTFKDTFNDKIYDDIFKINLNNYNINDGSINNFKVGYMIFCPTFKCNAECIMCNTFKLGKNEIKLLRIEDYYSKENLSTIKTLILQGGEVMMFPQIFKSLDKLIPKNCQLCIITNGMFYNDEILEILNNFNKTHLIFSLDGNAETNDLFRIKTNYNTIINNMKKIYHKYNDIEFEINYTVHQLNIDRILLDINDIKNDIYPIKLNSICINPVIEPEWLSIRKLKIDKQKQLLELFTNDCEYNDLDLKSLINLLKYSVKNGGRYDM